MLRRVLSLSSIAGFLTAARFEPQKHHRPFDADRGRRSIRLPDYDYSQPGTYFITIVAHGRECLFGKIQEDEMQLNSAGQIIWDVWNSLPGRYPQIELGAAQVMPNHFHGIIIIPVRAIHELPLQRLVPQGRIERRRMTIPLVVGYFKMNTAKRINQIQGSEGNPVWQRNYGACPECPSGRIEGNILFEMRQNTIAFTCISSRIRPTGSWTMNILRNRHDKWYQYRRSCC